MKINFNVNSQLTNCCSTIQQPATGNYVMNNHQINSSFQLSHQYPVAIIGSGPVGLAAAAHLALAGQTFIILEKGNEVAENIKTWQHVRLFSPWKYNIDKASKQLLIDNGWSMPSLDTIPTGQEIREAYLIPLANLPQIQPFIFLNTKVVGVSKKNLDKMKTANRESAPFVVYVDQKGVKNRILASAVIDASGTWSQPNPVLSDNVYTAAEYMLANKIYYGIPNNTKERYIGKRVAVIGGGHSAINTILELENQMNIEITWILRKNSLEDAYGGKEKDALPARGELGSRIHNLVVQGRVKVFTPFYIQELEQKSSGIIIKGEGINGYQDLPPVDEIIANTGSRPDFSFLKEIRLSIDPLLESVEALGPLIDPNEHSCGTVRPHGERELRQPEAGFYIVGMKSYGRAPTFLMATGYEQVRSIVAYITGDIESASKVELELPATGVCSVDKIINNTTGCCG